MLRLTWGLDWGLRGGEVGRSPCYITEKNTMQSIQLNVTSLNTAHNLLRNYGQFTFKLLNNHCLTCYSLMLALVEWDFFFFYVWNIFIHSICCNNLQELTLPAWQTYEVGITTHFYRLLFLKWLCNTCLLPAPGDLLRRETPGLLAVRFGVAERLYDDFSTLHSGKTTQLKSPQHSNH